MPELKTLKVCFIGVGSIATRHIRNLQDVCTNRGIKLTVDVLRKTFSKPLADDLHINMVYKDVSEISSDYDVIFITNPTDFHMDTLQEVHNKARHFFIEKPITSVRNLDVANNFPYRKDSIYYVACPMRYLSIMQYLKNNVNPNSVITARSICSSYLPDWRPGTDYRQCYSAHKDMGGGVSIDLIHEWDYLVYLFGVPNKILSSIGQKSELEIDSDDYAAYIAEYPGKIVELHLDYFGREMIREIMLICKEDTIIGDFVNNTITFKKSGEVIELQESRDDNCKRELCHFLDMIEGKVENDNPPLVACQVMRLTQGEI